MRILRAAVELLEEKPLGADVPVRQIAERAGARVVHERRRGYGSAYLARPKKRIQAGPVEGMR